jgi:hypothetical protein
MLAILVVEASLIERFHGRSYRNAVLPVDANESASSGASSTSASALISDLWATEQNLP